VKGNDRELSLDISHWPVFEYLTLACLHISRIRLSSDISHWPVFRYLALACLQISSIFLVGPRKSAETFNLESQSPSEIRTGCLQNAIQTPSFANSTVNISYYVT
jgi:hypothetical protein